MSQIILNNVAGVNPSVPTQFTTDDDSVAVPLANNLNILGAQTAENNDQGIQTTADPASLIPPLAPDAGDTVYITLTNRQTGTGTTTDATVTEIISFLPDTNGNPGTIYVYGNVVAIATTGSGAAYSYSGAFTTDGAVITEIETELHDQFEELPFINADIFISTDGTNIIVEVQGDAGLSVNWNALLQYRQVEG